MSLFRTSKASASASASAVAAASAEGLVLILPSLEDAVSALALTPTLTPNTETKAKVDESDCASATASASATAWRTLSIQIIHYATTATATTTSTVDNEKDSNGDNGSDSERVKQAAELLMQIINQIHNNNNNDNADDVNNNSNNMNMNMNSDDAISILIDTLWLAGSMLSDTTKNTTTSTSTSNVTTNATPYKLLCQLLTLLATPSPSPSHTTTTTSHNPTLPLPLPIPCLPFRPLVTSLEPSLLRDANILKGTRTHELFLKKLRKCNTDMYYRQHKVNLMQEESEGYAKFMTYLVNIGSNSYSDGDGDGISDGDCVRNDVLECMGTFDLDPNRCLDLTLDILESQIQSALANNSNNSSSTSTSTTATSTSPLVQVMKNSPEESKTIHLLLAICAMFPMDHVTHLMGFRYIHYANGIDIDIDIASKSKSKASKKYKYKLIRPPRSLFVTTGILTCHGLLSLQALRAHLPPLEEITAQYDLHVLEVKTRIKKMGVVSLNSSSSVSVSASSSVSASTKKEAAGNGNGDGEEGEEIPQTIVEQMTHHQLISLVCILLEMGVEWDTVMELLGNGNGNGKDKESRRITSAADAAADAAQVLIQCACLHPPLGGLLCQITEGVIETLYTKRVTTGTVGADMCLDDRDRDRKDEDDGEVMEKINKDGEGIYSLYPLHGSRSSEQTYGQTLPPLGEDSTLTQLCTHLIKDNSGDIGCIMEAIVMSGCLATHPILYSKVCRLVHAMLLDEKKKQASTSMDLEELDVDLDPATESLLERFVVPSLSLFPFNPAMASECWSVLSLLPYHIRYALYASWRQYGLEKAALRSRVVTPAPKPLANIASEVTTGIATKYVLKRMSKDNIRDMGRQVSKISHNNPLVVFTLMLNQIESYDNLIVMMVETFKFMGVLSLDIMGYCLLVSMGGEGEGRNKLKDDGVNAAQWLSSLETFTGAFYKRFPDVELRGMLAYFMRRLHQGQILELGVLQSLLKMAGGYGFVDSGPGSVASLSAVQLDGRCGSLALRRETSDFGIVEKVNVRSSTRLRYSLQGGDRGVTFLILLSQLRNKVLYCEGRESPKQIKLIGNLYDKCHRTLNTMLAFLTDGSQDGLGDSTSTRSAKGKGAIATYAESIPTLGELIRDFNVGTADAWAMCRPLVRAALFAEEDTMMTTDTTSSDSSDATTIDNIPKHLQPYHPTSKEMVSNYSFMLPKDAWQYITPTLFRRFYSYGIYDLTYPQERYENEISCLKKEIDRLLMLQKGGRGAMGMQASLAAAAVPTAAGGSHQDIQEATTFTREHGQELDRYRYSVERLKADMTQQKKHYGHVMEVFKSDKNAFLSNLNINGNTNGNGDSSTASVFLTTCIYPRCLLSPDDAMYCAKFIAILYEMETPGFHILELFDVIISAIAGALYSITEDEAGCFGIFLENIWGTVSEWRYDGKSYAAQMEGKNSATFKKSDRISDKDDTPSSSLLTHAEFVALYNEWHATIGASFIGCLRSSEYMHNRTALITLSRMVDVYPTKSTFGDKLLSTLKPLQEDSNPMQDIKAMAQGYSSKIIRVRDTGSWKEEDSKATKARTDREKKLQEGRKKNAERQMEQMKTDALQISKQIGSDGRDRDSSRRHIDAKGQGMGQGQTQSSARFTPPPASSSAPSRHPRDQRDSSTRRDDGRGGAGEGGNSGNGGGGGGGLQGRWERTGPNSGPSDSGAGRSKRGRSPDTTSRGSDGRNGGGRDRDRESGRDRDAKRSRREPSPPRRGNRRSAGGGGRR